MESEFESSRIQHSVSVVVPVYLGSKTLGTLLEEIRPFVKPTLSPGGIEFQVKEVVLVNLLKIELILILVYIIILKME